MANVRVAINGFGRIGRLAFRQMFGAKGYQVVAINDLTSPAMLAHLLKYDTAQGSFLGKYGENNHTVEATENSIIVDGKEIRIYAEKDAAKVAEAQDAVDNGCQEFDYVCNVGKVKEQTANGIEREFIDYVKRTGSIRSTGIVAKIDKVILWQLGPDFPQNSQPAITRIKYSDTHFRPDYQRTPSSFFTAAVMSTALSLL